MADFPSFPAAFPTAGDVDGLRRLARGLLRDADLADDAAQDAWLAAQGSARPAGMAWLYGFVRNRGRQLLRAEGRRRAREGHAPAREAAREPVDHVAALEEQRRVLEALQALAEPYRLT